jgi:hypothetical protein
LQKECIVLSSDEDEPRSKVQKCDSQSDLSSTTTTTNGVHPLLMQRIIELNTSNDPTSAVNNILAAASKELQCSNVNSTLSLSPKKITKIKTTEIMPVGTIQEPTTSLVPALDPQPSIKVDKSEKT